MISEQTKDDWSAWMAAAQTGDTKAYHKLLSAITPLLKNFIRKRVPSELTDDISQDVLMAIHNVRHTYDPSKPFHSWMFAIARHKLIDALRKNGRKINREAVSLDEIETFIADDSNAYEKQDTRRELAGALSELNEKQRTIVTLMKVGGLSAQEVSEKTGMSVSAVKVTAHRAYKKLKDKLST